MRVSQQYIVPIPQPENINFDVKQADPNTGNIDSFSLSVIPVIRDSLSDGGTNSALYLTTDNDLVKVAPGAIGGTSENQNVFSLIETKSLFALDGDDFIVGSIILDPIYGNAGNDTIFGDGINQVDFEEEGISDDPGPYGDFLSGGKGNDVISGGRGDDLIWGERDNDYLYGNEGADTLRGGKGEDVLVGNGGNDVLVGEQGIDRLWGGESRDVFILIREEGVDVPNYGYNEPPSDINTAYQKVPADIILDYTPGDDVVGLTGGLSYKDVIMFEKYIVLGDRRDYRENGPFPLNQDRTADFQVETSLATIITEGSTGNILGIVRGVSPNLVSIATIL
jgi:Ca2+-binding RTX toxin-like protein